MIWFCQKFYFPQISFFPFFSLSIFFPISKPTGGGGETQSCTGLRKTTSLSRYITHFLINRAEFRRIRGSIRGRLSSSMLNRWRQSLIFLLFHLFAVLFRENGEGGDDRDKDDDQINDHLRQDGTWTVNGSHVDPFLKLWRQITSRGTYYQYNLYNVKRKKPLPFNST